MEKRCDTADQKLVQLIRGVRFFMVKSHVRFYRSESHVTYADP